MRGTSITAKFHFYFVLRPWWISDIRTEHRQRTYIAYEFCTFKKKHTKLVFIINLKVVCCICLFRCAQEHGAGTAETRKPAVTWVKRFKRLKRGMKRRECLIAQQNILFAVFKGRGRWSGFAHSSTTLSVSASDPAQERVSCRSRQCSVPSQTPGYI